MAEPIRTCTGCRQRDQKRALLRVVAEAGRAIADPDARRPGRGAYVHRRAACIERAVKRSAFVRALGSASSTEKLAQDLIAGVAIQSGKRQ